MERRPSIVVLTVAAVGLPVVLAAAALVWLVYRSGRDVSEELSEQYLAGVARQAELDLGDYSAGATRVSQRYLEAVRTGRLPGQVGPAWESDLRLDVAARRVIEAIVFVSAEGGAAWAERRGEDVVVVSQREGTALRATAWYQAGAKSAEPVWARWPAAERPGLGDGPVIGLTRGLSDHDGRLVGVLGVNVMTSAMSAKLRALLPTPDSVLYLVDAQGGVVAGTGPLAQSNGAIPLTLHQASPELARIMDEVSAEGARGRQHRTSNMPGTSEPGRVQIGTVRLGPGLSMKLVALVPERAFLLGANRAVNTAVLLGLAAVAGALVVGIVFARMLVKPVRATRTLAERVERGEFGVETNYPAPAQEWVDVRAALERMSGKLAERERLREQVDRTGAELRLSEARYRALFEDAPEAVLVISLDSGRILEVNEACCRISGRTRQAMVGQSAAAVSGMVRREGQADVAPLTELMTRAAAGERVEYQVRMQRPNGEEFVVQSVLVRHESAGERLIRATMTDVTALVRATEALEAANAKLEERVKERTKQLEATNAELEAFTYSVSHDLRAPLRHINGFVRLLDQQGGMAMNETSKRYMGVIAESANRMGRLIDDLLGFARVARAEPNRMPVDMNALVDEALTTLAPASQATRIDWNRPPLPAVEGDPALLRQVWINLIDNAIKYSGRLERAHIQVGARREGSDWVFFVADNGAGFDPRYAARLFGVFQRLHAESEFPGTGIGLATVRRIVGRHGGRTWAESELGRGATFYFSLPGKEAAA
ncbi:MAG: sensor histidine kinase [Phycisphaerales bacterium]